MQTHVRTQTYTHTNTHAHIQQTQKLNVPLLQTYHAFFKDTQPGHLITSHRNGTIMVHFDVVKFNGLHSFVRPEPTTCYLQNTIFEVTTPWMQKHGESAIHS